MNSKKAKIRYYSDVFKLTIVQEVAQGKLTKEAARRKYGVKGKSAVLNWMRKFGYLSKLDITVKLDQKKQEITPTVTQLIEENKILKRQLEDEKIRAIAYSFMIDAAEETYKIPIRKKALTKQ